jgi:hypothetical protein
LGELIVFARRKGSNKVELFSSVAVEAIKNQACGGFGCCSFLCIDNSHHIQGKTRKKYGNATYIKDKEYNASRDAFFYQ